MKKFLSLVLALVMALSLTTVAWGAVTDEASFVDAIDAATAGDTITLDNAITIAGNVTVDKAVTINANGIVDAITVTGTLTLNAGTVTSDHGAIFYVNGGKLVVNGATIASTDYDTATDDQYYATVFVDAAGSVTVNSGSVWSAKTTVVSVSGATLTINDGAVYNTEAAPVAVANGDVPVAVQAKNATVNVSGGAVYSNTSSAIRLDSGSLAIEGDAHVYTNAVSPKYVTVFGYAGDITVSDDAVIEANTAPSALVSCGSDVTVEGGTVEGVKAHESANAKVTVEGGNITGAVSEGAVGTVVITAGTFADDVSAYVAPTAGFVTNPDGTVTVGAKATTGTYDLYSCNNPVAATTTGLSYTKVAAAQSTDGTGTVAHVAVNNGKNYVEISAFEATKGDFYLTNAGAATAVMYLREVTAVIYSATAAEFTNFGYACGQYTKTYGDTNDYYQVLTGANKGKVYAAGNGGAAVLVDGEVIELAVTPVTLNAHVWSTTAADATTGIPTAAICAKCSARGTVYATTDKVPASATIDGAKLLYNGVQYPVVAGVKTVVGTTTGTVQSAETFDAGIAMYVGMSVLAATGSAVVLKKREG